jgi:hypothetical protein
MEVEYRKDLRHNYMVIAKDDALNPGQYCIDLLEHQTIDGILPFELRRFDNRVFYYYEITGKQSMGNIFEKAVLNYDSIKDIFREIIEILEKAYEYLLPEDDFVLSPEFIYMNIVINRPNLCYLPGSAKSIYSQMRSLLEYLMNKVDYNDKDAVLLIYQLYAVSREEEFTLDQLFEVLEKNQQDKLTERTTQKKAERRPEASDRPTEIGTKCWSANDGSSAEEDIVTRGNASGIRKELFRFKSDDNDEDELPADVPLMKEKIESEAEIAVYPIQNLVLSGICIVIGALLIILGFTTGILYNSFGNRIDYSKLLALVLIILCSEGYGLKKLLDKKNKVTKVVKTCEYVDPRKSIELQGIKRKRTPKPHISDHIDLDDDKENDQTLHNQGLPKDRETEYLDEVKSLTDLKKQSKAFVESNERPLEKNCEDEDDNPTCLLSSLADKKSELILKALDEINYNDIIISTFPFFIGKLKKNVDYCLEKDVISRYHAKITTEDERYFITDLNSTNGTYINGEALMTYQKKEIKIGDEIVLADIRFLFVTK